ncbi:MAG TPA: DUF4136 domain-containing protein [Gemmatimonadota bacterium]|nr:DUF4136 domain-containing protein [Gemmatimonadota bacterium]
MKYRVSLLAFVVAIGGCGGGLKVQSDFDPAADFGGWQTYRWAERTDEGKQDRRVYNYVVEGRIRRAVNRALVARGFREDSTTTQPDFLVGWHASLQGQVNFSTFGTYYRYGWGWYDPYSVGLYSYQTYTNYTKEGTLLIDIVDASRNELVWRAIGSGVVGDPDRTEAKKQADLDKVVEHMLADFPPRPGG